MTLDVRIGVLFDGTIFISRTTMNAKTKRTQVKVEHSGHRRVGGG